MSSWSARARARINPQCYFNPVTKQRRGFLMTLYGSVGGAETGASSLGNRPGFSDYCRCQGESAQQLSSWKVLRRINASSRTDDLVFFLLNVHTFEINHHRVGPCTNWRWINDKTSTGDVHSPRVNEPHPVMAQQHFRAQCPPLSVKKPFWDKRTAEKP